MTESKDSGAVVHSSVGGHTGWEPEDPVGWFQVSWRPLVGVRALLTGLTMRVHTDYLGVEQMVVRYTAKVHDELAAAAEEIQDSTTAAAVHMRLPRTKMAFPGVDMIVARL